MVQLHLQLLRFLREHEVYVQQRYVARWFVTAQHDAADAERTVDLVGRFLQMHRTDLAL
jgi:hypothetical protein